MSSLSARNDPRSPPHPSSPSPTSPPPTVFTTFCSTDPPPSSSSPTSCTITTTTATPSARSPRMNVKRSSSNDVGSPRHRKKKSSSSTREPGSESAPTMIPMAGGLPVRLSVSFLSLSVTGLSKRDLVSKPDCYLKILFGEHTPLTTPVIKAELEPKWDAPALNFEYTPRRDLTQERLVLYIWDVQRFGEVCVGYTEVDLLTVVTGPKEHDLFLKKKKKKKPICDSDELTKAKIKFSIEINCKAEVQIRLQDVSCVRIKPCERENNMLFLTNWSNDPFMEYFLESYPGNIVRTNVCYNTLAPSWMECKPLTTNGTIKEILNQVLVINLYHHSSNNGQELLGTCKVPISKYYSLKCVSVPFVEPLLYKQAPHGEIKASLLMKGLPPFSQMEGGYHNEQGIFGNAKPIVKELAIQETSNFRVQLDSPLFPPPKPKQRKILLSAKLNADSLQLQQQFKDILKKLKSSSSDEAPRIAEALANLVETDVPRSSKIFRNDRIIVSLLKILKRNSNLALRKELCRTLWLVCRNDSKNQDVIRMSDGIHVLCKHLQTEDEKLFEYCSGILLPLSLRDSGIQEVFQLEESIHFLVEMLGKSKKDEVVSQIVKILGNLCYGIAGGEPNNRDVIRHSGGIKELVQRLSGAEDELQKNIKNTIQLLVFCNHENRKDVISKLFIALNNNLTHTNANNNNNNNNNNNKNNKDNKDDKDDKDKDDKDKKTDDNHNNDNKDNKDNKDNNDNKDNKDNKDNNDNKDNKDNNDNKDNKDNNKNDHNENDDNKNKCNIVYLRLMWSLLSMKSDNPAEDEEVKHMFLSLAAIPLMRFQVISEDKEFVALCRDLLNNYTTTGSEQKLITDLIQTLWTSENASEKQMAIETIFSSIKRNVAALRPLEEAIRNKNAIAPLLAAVLQNGSSKNVDLVLVPLRLLKIVTTPPNHEICKILMETGGPDFVKCLTSLFFHENRKIQKNSLEIASHLTKLEKRQDLFSHLDLLPSLIQILSDTSITPGLKESCLRFIHSYLLFADNSRKIEFKDLGGIVEMNKILLKGFTHGGEYAIKILHSICFPFVEELRDVVHCVVSEKVLETFCAQLSNPLLFKPTVHPIIPSIISTLRDLCADPEVRKSLKEDFIVSLLGNLTSNNVNDTEVVLEARTCLKSWGYGPICSCVSFGSSGVVQPYGECLECGLTGEDGVCSSCIETCHRGHQVKTHNSTSLFVCKCGGTQFCNAQKATKDPKPMFACSFIFSGRKSKLQDSYQCKTCFSTADKFLCTMCSKSACHKGHIIIFSGPQNFTCCCGDRIKGCKLREVIDSTNGETSKSPQQQQQLQQSDDTDNEEEFCIVCFENKKDTVFYKCGHLACCNHCAILMRDKKAECPICRATILDVTKVYQV